MDHDQRMTAQAEAIKYKYVWENCETYGDKHHDVDLWLRNLEYLDPFPNASILVLGCGDGSLVHLLDGCGYN